MVFLAEFRAHFPELDGTVDDAAVGRAEVVARQMVRGQKEQLLWATAHVATVDGAGSGEVMSSKVGQVSVSYRTQAKKANDVYWSRTEYGRTYLALRNANPQTGIAMRVY